MTAQNLHPIKAHIKPWTELSPRADFTCAATCAAPTIIKQGFETLQRTEISIPKAFVEFGAGNVPLVAEEIRNYYLAHPEDRVSIFLEDPRYENILVRLHALSEIISCISDIQIGQGNSSVFQTQALEQTSKLLSLLAPQSMASRTFQGTPEELEVEVTSFLQSIMDITFNSEVVEAYPFGQLPDSYNLVINNLFNYVGLETAQRILNEPGIATICYVNGSSNLPVESDASNSDILVPQRKFKKARLEARSSLDVLCEPDCNGQIVDDKFTVLNCAIVRSPSGHFNDPANRVRNPEFVFLLVNNRLISDTDYFMAHQHFYMIDDPRNLYSEYKRNQHNPLSQDFYYEY